MDYKLQWKIEKRIGMPYIPSTSGVRLTPFPAIDYVNPGCDAKLYQFYVPIHASSSPHVINKKVDVVGVSNSENLSENSLEQIGSGLDVGVDNENPSEDPVSYNEAKKKKLGDTIQNNFLHPVQPVETGKLLMYNSEKKGKTLPKKKTVLHSTPPKQEEKKDLKIKHKFFVI